MRLNKRLKEIIEMRGNFYRRYLKRGIDIVFSFLAFIILLLPLTIIALIIRLTMGKPVLFKQVRPGLNGKPFTIYKFRTMKNGPGADEERLTKFGRFLRRFSLDELPELFNVLKGDMSLVGPRPLLMKYMPYFTHRERLRFRVRPGITGLAQISGRNFVNWDKRLELDVQYTEQISLTFDMKILMKTFLAVITREGLAVNADQAELPLDEERGKSPGE